MAREYRRESDDKKLKKIENELDSLPLYIYSFIRHYRTKKSLSSLLSYLYDYQSFFEWIVAEGLYLGTKKDVPLETLEKLRLEEIDFYTDYLEIHKNNSKATINRKMASLKSLFYYLSQIAEDEQYYPLLKRNVMAKVEINKKKTDVETRAIAIAESILTDEEISQFREFVAIGYGELFKDHPQKFNAYIMNRERDISIISLFLGSGLRLQELVGIDSDDISWTNNYVNVIRKGKDSTKPVYFSDVALLDLQEYKRIRDTRYPTGKDHKAFFLSSPRKSGVSSRITVRSIQAMLEKYAAAFGKNDLTVHKLRHSFATNFQNKHNNLPLLQEQLGHADINTTMIYTHIKRDDLKNAVKDADE
jgi:site-specific recombinase XerD